MPYYRFDNGLQPLSAPPEDWQGVLAVLEPSELHSAPLPSWLTPPAAPADPHESQFCWLRIDRDGVTGHLRTPVRASQSARHMGFTWTRDCLLLSDPDHAAADCIAHLTTQRTQPPGSPDAFVVALLIALIRDDLPYIQQLETRLTNLEQAVLDNETGRFLHQMSVIRKELNRANRFTPSSATSPRLCWRRRRICSAATARSGWGISCGRWRACRARRGYCTNTPPRSAASIRRRWTLPRTG